MIKFTSEALRIMTENQKQTILTLAAEKHEMTITSHDFSVPSNWLSFVLTYHNTDTAIYGGISPDRILTLRKGEAHT